MKFTVLAIAFAAVAASSSSLSAATASHVSYTAAQATQGRSLYYAKCAMCHGVNLEGISGPALKGSDSNLAAQTVSAVYTYTTVQMPVGNAGGLSKDNYVKLMAFILQNNGVPAGSAPATPKTLEAANVDIGKSR